MPDFKKGDRIRLTIEGTVIYGDSPETDELQLDLGNESRSNVYIEFPRSVGQDATWEIIAPPKIPSNAKTIRFKRLDGFSNEWLDEYATRYGDPGNRVWRRGSRADNCNEDYLIEVIGDADVEVLEVLK